MQSSARVTTVGVLWLLLCGCDQFADVGRLARPRDPRVDDATLPNDAGSADGAVIDLLMLQECGATNPAGLSPSQITALRAGGPLSEGSRVLYPYEGTVFPAGLAAPLLMWESATPADAVLLNARSQSLSYEGCLKPKTAGQLPLPDTLWKAAELRGHGKDDPLELELTTLQAGKVSGPLRLSILLSPQTIEGTLYYSSYGSPGAPALNLAAVMRLPLGGVAKPFVAPSSACAGCHAASADGSTLLVSNTGSGQAYRLPTAQGVNPTPFLSMVSGVEYAALDPTGSLYVAGAMAGASAGPPRRSAGPATATLFDLEKGTAFPESGLPAAAFTPAFSPDGGSLAFNDMTESPGHALAVISFSSKDRTFANHRQFFSHATLYPAWPSFRPDGQQVVFALGERADFTANGTLLSAGQAAPGPASDLYLTELAGDTTTMLFRAMGFASKSDASANATYLPFGAVDLHQNYYPNVLPSGSTDYDWVFFDSVRHYGNQGVMRAIWCAALDVAKDGTLATDPSHPPFYVPGQELGAPNLRPIAAKALSSGK